MSRIFGAVAQNGYVVRDVEAAMRHWVDILGVGPWFYFERVQTDWFRHRGVDSPLEVSIALANSGDLQIELIQQRNDAPSMYREFLAAGREGLQHLAYWTRDYQALYDRALALGYRVGHEGQIGGEQGRFAYFETETHPGTVVEISDVSGAKGAFFDLVRRAALDWDGSDPVRALAGRYETGYPATTAGPPAGSRVRFRAPHEPPRLAGEAPDGAPDDIRGTARGRP